MAMLAAVTPYLSWMQAAGETAGEAAAQATAAATAHETAFAAHVPPAEVSANRTPTGAARGDQHLRAERPGHRVDRDPVRRRCGVQDALAMDGYAGSLSAAATKLTPIHRGAANRQRQRAGEPGGRGRPGRRYLGGQRAVDRVVAVVTPQPDLIATASGRQPRHGLHGHIEWVFELPVWARSTSALYTSPVQRHKGSTWSSPAGSTTSGCWSTSPPRSFSSSPRTPAARRRSRGTPLEPGLGTTLGPGHAVRLGHAGGEFRPGHTGRRLASSTQLGHGHPGHQDGRRRIVGRRTGRSASGGAGRGRTAQFGVPGGHARCRGGCRGSRRCQGRRAGPSHPTQGPQGQHLAGEVEASGRTDIGETRKRAAPSCRSRRPGQPAGATGEETRHPRGALEKRRQAPSCAVGCAVGIGCNLIQCTSCLLLNPDAACGSDLGDRDPAWVRR